MADEIMADVKRNRLALFAQDLAPLFNRTILRNQYLMTLGEEDDASMSVNVQLIENMGYPIGVLFGVPISLLSFIVLREIFHNSTDILYVPKYYCQLLKNVQTPGYLHA